jgi:subtilisin family serine protease
MKKFLVAVVALAFCATAFTSVFVHSQSKEERPLEVVQKGEKLLKVKKPIEGRYIVVLEDWAAGNLGEESKSEELASELSIIYNGKVDRVFKHALNGFSVEMSEKYAEVLSTDPRVRYVEEDGEVYASAVQTGATWGLDRIDERDLPRDGNYVYNTTASNVHVYVIDTGIRTSHNQFGGRANAVFDAFGGNGQDCNGHGTHVAGTVGGSTYGVAKGVRLHAVRVLNCQGSGTNAGVIAGVDWVRANRQNPAVANMSLGGGASSSLDSAVSNAIASGVTFAVAAGNSNANACNFSPARVSSAITVGSTTSSDARSSFSNFGTCVDIFAPGSSITSAWYTSNTATNTISGTSMASPHVAGVAALYLAVNTGASPSTVRNAIVNTSTTGRLTGIGSGSPNRLLYSLLTTP